MTKTQIRRLEERGYTVSIRLGPCRASYTVYVPIARTGSGGYVYGMKAFCFSEEFLP